MLAYSGNALPDALETSQSGIGHGMESDMVA